jgi:hypothetical protein
LPRRRFYPRSSDRDVSGRQIFRSNRWRHLRERCIRRARWWKSTESKRKHVDFWGSRVQ